MLELEGIFLEKIPLLIKITLLVTFLLGIKNQSPNSHSKSWNPWNFTMESRFPFRLMLKILPWNLFHREILSIKRVLLAMRPDMSLKSIPIMMSLLVMSWHQIWANFSNFATKNSLVGESQSHSNKIYLS